jgi:hypothetical protein
VSGATAYAATATGAKHADPFPPTTAQNYWQPKMTNYVFGRESFRVTAYRKQRPTVSLDQLVDQIGWERNGAAPRTGTLEFYRPLGYDEADTIQQADQIEIDVSLTGPKGPWYQFLRLGVSNPQESVVAGVTDLTLETINIASLTQSKAKWLFSPDKQHPGGWTAPEITVYACNRFNAPIGKIAPSTAKLSAIKDNASAYDVIIKAWQQERVLTGRRYVIDDDRGNLEVTEVSKPRYMLPLGPALMEAVKSSFTGSYYANAVVVEGHAKNTGKTSAGNARRGSSSVQMTVVNHLGIKRFGYVQKVITAPSNINTSAGLYDYGLKYLARYATPHPSIEVTHPGIPWVDVGDALLLTIPEIKFNQMVYVQSVTHAVSAGTYSMDIVCGYNDPWLEDQSSKTGSTRIRGLHNQKGSHYLAASARPKTAKAVVHAGKTKG